jgi:hypothetical protein
MRAYSFLDSVVLVNGTEITGWAEGDDVIDIKRLVDSATHKVGADGNMVLSITADRSGSISFKLMQTSSSNKFLMNLMNLQEAGGPSFTPLNVLVQDTYRGDGFKGPVGYLKKPADVQRGAGVAVQTWEIIVENLNLALGDQPDLTPTSAS